MVEQDLQLVANTIRSQYHHAKVLLFGSYAKDAQGPGSDIDLCIILENPPKRTIEISRSIRKEIYPVLKRPLDILVYDKRTFDERASSPLTLESEIKDSAREL